jgi:amino acid transporter
MTSSAEDPRLSTPPPVASPTVGLLDALVVGISSSGPAQTLAVSLASLVAACGVGGGLPVLLCMLPMLGIAIGYRRLNRWTPDSGATYRWVADVFHPLLGFLSGWMILLYYTLGTSSLTLPAGSYTLSLLAPAYLDRPWAIALAGGSWNLVVTALALLGLKVAARFERLVVLFQYGVLLALAGAGLRLIVRGELALPAHAFTLAGLGGARGLVTGVLIACFMYSGWDAAIYLNEESTDGANDPGRAAIASVLVLGLLYALAVTGLSPVLDGATLAAHAGDALGLIGERLLGAGTLTSLAVITGTLATLQAAVLAAARVSRAMARDHVMPAAFARVDPRTGNPWAATLVMSGLNLLLLGIALTTGGIGQALSQVVASIGLIAILFYGLTAAAALWQGRALLLASAADFWLGGVLPGLGVLFMLAVLIATVLTDAIAPAALAWGLGSVVAGLVIALIMNFGFRHPFFSGPRRPLPESAP